VVEANRAIAVGMAQGPAAGLALLEAAARDPRLARWPQVEVQGRALAPLDRRDEAVEA
jgi:RNA polymerase sigma-70 factor (ECF subfamily)